MMAPDDNLAPEFMTVTWASGPLGIGGAVGIALVKEVLLETIALVRSVLVGIEGLYIYDIIGGGVLVAGE